MDEGIKRKKVLIVEDDASIGRILGQILGKMDREHSLVLSAPTEILIAGEDVMTLDQLVELLK